MEQYVGWPTADVRLLSDGFPFLENDLKHAVNARTVRLWNRLLLSLVISGLYNGGPVSMQSILLKSVNADRRCFVAYVLCLSVCHLMRGEGLVLLARPTQ